MSIARALAVLGAGLGGMSAGERQAIEDQRRREREDEDAAFRKETRDRQRTEWTRADQEYADRQAEKQAMRTAGAPVEVKPELAPDQQGPQGFVVNGQTFGDPTKARTVADAANAPSARLGRMALASRDPLRGVELQAAASQAELTAMQMQQARAAQEAQEWDRKLYDSLVGSPSKIADPGSITAFMTASAADGMDGSSKWAHKVEGDKLTIYPVGPDGTALNTGFTIPNTLEGRIELAARLSKGTPISAKLADIRAQQKAAAEAADKKADNARLDKQQAEQERHNKAVEGIQSTEASTRAAAVGKKDGLFERMDEADKVQYQSLAKRAESIDAAITKAQAEGMWNEESPNAKLLRQQQAAIGVQMRGVLSRYRDDGAAADPLGLRKPTGKAGAPASAPSAASSPDQAARDAEAGKLIIASELGGDLTKAEAYAKDLEAKADKEQSVKGKSIYRSEAARVRAGIVAMSQAKAQPKRGMAAVAAPPPIVPAAEPPAPAAAPVSRENQIAQIEAALAVDDRIKQGGLGGIAMRAIQERAMPLGMVERKDLERKLASLRGN